MPDDTRLHSSHAPGTWSEAFAALPSERPDGDPWMELAPRLSSRTSTRWPAWLAVAAAVTLAVVVPLTLRETPTDAPAPQVAPATPPGTIDPLEQLYAQSAQLEALLAIARDERVASGAAAEVAADLDAELARIDAQLRQPGLSRERQLALWRERVDTLGSIVGFEGTRRWLAAHGQRYDGALVRVD
jgi:hypothetical protein